MVNSKDKQNEVNLACVEDKDPIDDVFVNNFFCEDTSNGQLF